MKVRRWVLAGGLALLALAALGGAALYTARPPRAPVQRALFEGVQYTRQIRSSPRPLVLHIARLDLQTPGLGLGVSPGDDSRGEDVRAALTTDFLRQSQAQLAINGSFFSPFYSNGPLDYYPRQGDPVNVHGLAISQGVVYSADYPSLPLLCAKQERERPRVRFGEGSCPSGTQHAMAGGGWLLRQGQVVVRQEEQPTLHPRTVLGLDEARRTLWLVVVDGRQPGYSEGASQYEVALWMKELGAHEAINLDGGGSSTMAARLQGEVELLNAPVHTSIPGRERPVANHLVVFAPPLPAREAL